MSSATPVRRFFSAAVAALALVAGAPFLSGVAHATHAVSGSDPSGAVNDGIRVVDIFGTGFLPTDQVSLVRDGTSESISGTRDNTFQSASTIRASFELRLANPGAYDIRVTRGVDVAECNACFTIDQPTAPSVTNVTRSTASNAPAGSLVITGTGGFTRGSVVEFWVNGVKDNGLTFTPDAITTNNRITGVYSYTAGAFTPGVHDVVVRNTDGKSGQCTGCFSQPRVDSVTPSSLGRGASNRTVVVNGAGLLNSTASFSGSGITYNGIQSSTASSITMNVSVAADAATGARNVIARHPSGGYYTLTNGFTVNPAPSITSVSPENVGQGATERTLTVTGTGFRTGAQFGISGTGVTIVSANYVSATRYDLVVSVASDAPLGARDLTISNDDGGSNTLEDAITITAKPTVGRVVPASRLVGTSGQHTFYGENFHGSVTIDLGPDITVSNIVSTPSPTGEDSITATVTVAAGAASGFRTVTIRNTDDAGVGTCTTCFGVNGFTVTPGSVTNTNTSPTTFTLSRPAGFTSTTPVTFFRSGTTPGSDAIAGIVENGTTATTIIVSANFSGAAPGAWSVKVGSADYCVRCVTVQGGTPTLSGAVPDAAAQGADELLVTITGSNLANDGTIEFLTAAGLQDPSITVVPGSYVVNSSTSVQVRINVTDDATIGPRSIRYTDSSTPVAKTATCSLCFEVTSPPTINDNGVSPSTRGQGAASTVITITGQGFQDGVTVDFGPGTTAGDAVVTQGSAGGNDTIKVPVTIAGDATVGTRTVTIRNPDGGTDTCTCFTVNAAPTLSSISPSAARPGTSVNVTLTGSGFVNGAGLAVDAQSGITVSNLTYVSPTSLTATFTIASNAALGSRDVYVTNPDGGRATGVKVFKVADLPGKVANLTATAGDKQASLTWTAPSNGGSSILDYTITCSPSCGNVIVSGSATSATVSGLSNGTTYTFRIRARNDVGTGEFSNPSNAVTPIGPEGEYVPVVPFRVYDTREADGPKMGSGTGAIRTVKVAGKGSVPTSGVSAVVLNITAINPTATAGNLRVYPADGSVPNTVTVTYRLGETVANLTEVNVSGGNGANSGSVKIFNSAGTVHVAVDVVGYFSDGRQGSPEGDHFFEAGPKRVVDTRNGVGTADAPMTAGETGIRTFDLHADSAVPDDATAVVVNVTATSAPKSGYVSLYPADATRPGVSNINVRAGQTVANLAVVKLGGGTSSTLGKIKAFSSGGTHLILDLVGYYSAVEGGAKFKGVSPARLATTVGGTKLAAGAIRSFKVAGVGPVPGPSVVRSVVIAVQAVNPEKLGFLQVWPSGAAPTTSVVNFPAGRNTLNLVVADIDENGFIKVRNGSQGATHVIIDVVGYNAVDVG